MISRCSYICLNFLYCARYAVLIIILSVFINKNIAFAGFFEKNDNFYKKDYSYNIFTADTWDMAQYFFIGYSYFGTKFSNIEYGSLLKKDQHGIAVGTGVIINKNWLFSINIQKVWQLTNIPHYCSSICKEIDKVKSEIFLVNSGVSLRLPFNLLERKLELYALTGIDIVSSHLANSYSKGTKTVPVEMVKNMSKVNFGIDIGGAVAYRIVPGVQIKFECKKIFLLLRKSALNKDGLVLNTLLSFDF